jgi:selenide,water dikinase
LVGVETSDDAGVYRLNEDTALVQTVDFFTPIVDEPYLFGQIAAANSLSDVYAMGAMPLTALNIVAFPKKVLPPEVLGEILRGGSDKVLEANAVILGGHTIENEEPIYGLCVTGALNPAKIWTNAQAKPGDSLVLTKKIGTGILAAASKAGMFAAGVAETHLSMKSLNNIACAQGRLFNVHACTDITGFGLLGHVYEMAEASGVKMEIDSALVPFFPDALSAAQEGLIPGGAYANLEYTAPRVSFAADVAEEVQMLCFDPQTSGGLLLSLPQDEAKELVRKLQANGVAAAAVIGRVTGKGDGSIYVK